MVDIKYRSFATMGKASVYDLSRYWKRSRL